MKSYKARGIVLHTMRYGESGLIVYMLTDLLGRQSYLVQGARNTKSGKGKGNKAALYQPMFVVDIVGLESPQIEMHRIKECVSALPMGSLPFDVRKSTIALFMAEVLYRLVREAEPHSPLFNFVVDAVAMLDALPSDAMVANFHLWFLVHLSAHLGFYPGNEYTPGSYFDIKEGLFTLFMPSHRLVMSRDNALIFSELMTASPFGLDAIKLTRSARASFLNVVLDYFGYHLDAIHNVNSIEILHDVF